MLYPNEALSRQLGHMHQPVSHQPWHSVRSQKVQERTHILWSSRGRRRFCGQDDGPAVHLFFPEQNLPNSTDGRTLEQWKIAQLHRFYLDELKDAEFFSSICTTWPWTIVMTTSPLKQSEARRNDQNELELWKRLSCNHHDLASYLSAGCGG